MFGGVVGEDVRILSLLGGHEPEYYLINTMKEPIRSSKGNRSPVLVVRFEHGRQPSLKALNFAVI